MLTISVFIAAALTIIFAVNSAVDPLWFHGGNRLFPENYSFNERHAKTNHFMRDPKAYDCIVFGSSRLTLFDEREIDGFNCFNFSISDGRPDEFVNFAEYVSRFGNNINLVIVGVDARILSLPNLSRPFFPAYDAHSLRWA